MLGLYRQTATYALLEYAACVCNKDSSAEFSEQDWLTAEVFKALGALNAIIRNYERLNDAFFFISWWSTTALLSFNRQKFWLGYIDFLIFGETAIRCCVF